MLNLDNEEEFELTPEEGLTPEEEENGFFIDPLEDDDYEDSEDSEDDYNREFDEEEDFYDY